MYNVTNINSKQVLTPASSCQKDFEQWAKTSDNVTYEDPFNSGLRVGQKVLFTNDYGCVFGPYRIMGFKKDAQSANARYVFLDKTSYWFAAYRTSLTLLDN